MKTMWWVVIGQVISWDFFHKYKTAFLKENRKFFLGLPLWRKGYFGPLRENAFNSSLKALMKQRCKILNTKCMFGCQDSSASSDFSSNQTISVYKKEEMPFPLVGFIQTNHVWPQCKLEGCLKLLHLELVEMKSHFVILRPTAA